eukprot:TRINITY_DN16428_c0_g1_i2.p1 TRINITY_DN16428_c0_g1~~TRINITY_DN16428_c0_g1_i2.p1  ORF type:complete len:330 (+),score=64.77 TRINITY_DN16428_c0_g1_i2:103-990(+)
MPAAGDHAALSAAAPWTLPPVRRGPERGVVERGVVERDALQRHGSARADRGAAAPGSATMLLPAVCTRGGAPPRVPPPRSPAGLLPPHGGACRSARMELFALAAAGKRETCRCGGRSPAEAAARRDADVADTSDPGTPPPPLSRLPPTVRERTDVKARRAAEHRAGELRRRNMQTQAEAARPEFIPSEEPRQRSPVAKRPRAGRVRPPRVAAPCMEAGISGGAAVVSRPVVRSAHRRRHLRRMPHPRPAPVLRQVPLVTPRAASPGGGRVPLPPAPGRHRSRPHDLGPWATPSGL